MQEAEGTHDSYSVDLVRGRGRPKCRCITAILNTVFILLLLLQSPSKTFFCIFDVWCACGVLTESLGGVIESEEEGRGWDCPRVMESEEEGDGTRNLNFYSKGLI